MTRSRYFTQRQRERLASQHRFGHRPVNNWGDGDLPAPWAEGDMLLLRLDRGDDEFYKRLTQYEGARLGYFVVETAFSIGEGDDWYFRVTDGEHGSDRLHVIAGEFDYMAPFELVDTADPHGLTLRGLLLEQGWTPPESTP
jgi:hypothetical protein